MEPFPEHIDPDLLIVYLSGEANPKEESAIQKWLAESEDNRAQFDALQKLWQEAEFFVSFFAGYSVFVSI